MTTHGPRRSLLTLLATEGVDLTALRTMAGRASVTTTINVYVHATRRHHVPVRRIVGDFLGVDELAAAGWWPVGGRERTGRGRRAEWPAGPRLRRCGVPYSMCGAGGMMGRWITMSCAVRCYGGSGTPEGLFDVALTNGLAAIVAFDNTGLERGTNGRMLSASALLKVLEDAGTSLTMGPYAKLLRSLSRCATAEQATRFLLASLYEQAAPDASGIAGIDDQFCQAENLEECDECWRITFPASFDEFGGTDSHGRCFACGYERDAETAWRDARDAEWARVMSKD
ncbi:hypothetical protein GCE86_08730 [Micromonospora terminaliae]|nr:hypothetical protein GCE86_08730 [Micromonospora terminaliae]